MESAIGFQFDIISSSIAVVGSITAWLLADARSKARIEFIEEKVNGVKSTLEIVAGTSQQRISSVELFQARSEQDRVEIHSNLVRLENGKASKDLVDSLRSDVNNLKLDMDKRFDRLERIIMESTRDRDRERERGRE